ncbi:hypothetical protein ABSA28_00868 [Candidatus Hepatincolaceae symbiont of Richtersius coronifer]
MIKKLIIASLIFLPLLSFVLITVKNRSIQAITLQDNPISKEAIIKDKIDIKVMKLID